MRPTSPAARNSTARNVERAGLPVVHATAASPEVAPAGYRLVDDDRHTIGLRDLVFVGGAQSRWVPARRAGELGEIRRFSTALAVAALAP